MKKILNRGMITVLLISMFIISNLFPVLGFKILKHHQNKFFNIEKNIIIRYRDNIPIFSIKAISPYEYGLKSGQFLMKYYKKPIFIIYKL